MLLCPFFNKRGLSLPANAVDTLPVKVGFPASWAGEKRRKQSTACFTNHNIVYFKQQEGEFTTLFENFKKLVITKCIY